MEMPATSMAPRRKVWETSARLWCAGRTLHAVASQAPLGEAKQSFAAKCVPK